MGETGVYELRVYCDELDCAFRGLGPVNDGSFMNIFRGKDRQEARRFALRSGWGTPGSVVSVTEGDRPAWMCPECAKNIAQVKV